MGGLTLDTGALLGLERNRRDIGKVIETARQGRDSITIPANAIAEWWRGRTDRRDYVLKMGTIQDVDARIARLAGEALASLKRHVEVNVRVTIDATVMATAALHGTNLYTGDFDDMERFAGFFPAVRLFGLRP
jgi:predicted nucleic acid-binding protein